ncbi:MAG: ArdC family protein [Anaerolineales bacterium]
MAKKKKKWAKLSPEKREAIKAAREQKLTEASARLASGVEALLKDNRWKEYLQFSMKFHQYSFFNMMLIMLQRPDATIVAGFETWKSMGRHVIKGEHGMDIFVPMFAGGYRKKTATAEEEAFGEEATDEPGTEESPKGGEGKTLVGFKIGSVFDVSQTDGPPLPERPYARLEGGDEGMFAVLKAAIEDLLQIPVTLSALPPRTIGYCRYDPDQDCRPIAITISDDPALSGAQKLDALAHEAGHALLHSGLEYRQHTERSIRELEAESVAFCTLSALGFDTSQMSFGYIATWAESGGEEPVKEIENSGQRILEASRRILNWIEENVGVPVEIEMAAEEKELVAA